MFVVVHAVHIINVKIVLGDVMVSVLAIGPKVQQTRPIAMDF
jgi:hypothetical protein